MAAAAKKNEELLESEKTAVRVLSESMIFYDEKAEGIIQKIIDILQTDPNPRGDLLANLYKRGEEARTKAIECAAKLAPYQSPRLESVESKQEIKHQFVVALPSQAEDPNRWLEAVKVEQRKIEEYKVIEGNKNANVPSF